jgi:hypothetical protein
LREVSLLQRRFRPLPARLVERHLHHFQASAPELHWVRLVCRPPLVEPLRKHPPAGSLMWEDGPDGSVISVAARRPEDLLPWLLFVQRRREVLSPACPSLADCSGRGRTLYCSRGPCGSGGNIARSKEGERSCRSTSTTARTAAAA